MVRGVFERNQNNKLVIPVNVEPIAAATSLACNGSMVAGGREEKRNGETKSANVALHHPPAHPSPRIVQTSYRLLRDPGKEEASLRPPPEPHPVGWRTPQRAYHRVGAALALLAPIASSPLLRFHTVSWSLPLEPACLRRQTPLVIYPMRTIEYQGANRLTDQGLLDLQIREHLSPPQWE